MLKKDILIYGYGYSYKRNIHWINQLYNVIGITDSSFTISNNNENLFVVKEALNLNYHYILVVSSYYKEIRDDLIHIYKVDKCKIKYFLDEFNEEKEISFGNKHKDITFYIFRAHWQEHKNGLFNYFLKILPLYSYTQSKGYQLLIDMKNYYTAYTEEYGRVNVWELYFKQPSKYNLDDAYNSSHVILSKFEDYKQEIPIKPDQDEKQAILEFGKLYVNNFQLTYELQNRLNKEKNMLHNRGKILGVLARGTDYIGLKPKNHPIPTNISDFIHYVKDYMDKENYQTIYLATEDLSILEKFQYSFGDELIYSEQMRTTNTGNRCLMDIDFKRENDRYLRGAEYIIVISMLSKCDGFIANCFCGGVWGTLLLNQAKWSSEQVEIMDNGIY